MPEIVQAANRIYYESHGTGYPLVMIRGLGSNADHWYAQVPDLSIQYRVIVFDNRGIARSSDPGGPFGVRDMAEDTIGMMDALQIEKAHIVGLSMGGMVAQELALRYPQRVNGLVLVVTHCGGAHQVNAAEEVMRTVRRMAVDDSPDARAQAAGVFFAPQTLQEHPHIALEYAQISMKHPAGAETLQRQLEAIQTHDAYDRLDRIQADTLVLTGELDVLVPPANSAILAERIARAELAIIPGGGHQILIEQPEACNRTMLAFLRRVDAIGAKKA